MAVNRTMISRLYAVIEDPSGVEETIAGTDICKLYGDGANIWQIEAADIALDPITGSMTRIPLPKGIVRTTGTFDYLLQGTGAPTAVPYWAKFWQAAGCDLTTTVIGDDTEYAITPSDDLADHKTLTVHAYHESNKHIGIGMTANNQLVCEAGQIWRCTTQLSGLSAATPVVGGQTPPAGTLQANRSPRFDGVQLTIDAYTTGTLRRFEFNTGATAVDDLDASATTSIRGLKGRVITSRQPTITMVLRAEHNLPKDFFSALVNGDLTTLSFSKASLDGEDTLSFEAEGQITAVPIANADGLLLYNISVMPRSDTPNADWALKVLTLTSEP